MAMTAADRLELQKQFVTLDDYVNDKDKMEKRLTCVEDNQKKNDLIVVRIDTQLKLILWVLATVGAAVIALVVRTFLG